tara:strand:+ start:499 stop:1014 length:516 start_codon:yes stop_codon:yes gene_type:complete
MNKITYIILFNLLYLINTYPIQNKLDIKNEVIHYANNLEQGFKEIAKIDCLNKLGNPPNHKLLEECETNKLFTYLNNSFNDMYILFQNCDNINYQNIILPYIYEKNSALNYLSNLINDYETYFRWVYDDNLNFNNKNLKDFCLNEIKILNKTIQIIPNINNINLNNNVIII